MSLIRNIVKRIKGVLNWEITQSLYDLKMEQANISRLVMSQVQISQRMLSLRYAEVFKNNPQMLPALSETGFRVHSEFEEDGLLLYIFSIIGARSKICVEIGTTDGVECNTTNLILYHGWKGLLIDGSEKMVERGKQFFARHPNAVLNEPKFIHHWITRQNINEVILAQGVKGEIDLLSIDIDGVDYYILEALTCINPRVIICEINSAIPLDKALTIPYSDSFYCWDKPAPRDTFRSLSMCAANKLMKGKGYRLVGAHRLGFNLIFLKDEIGAEVFPEISLEQARGEYFNHKEMGQLWEQIKDYEWVSV